MKLHTPDATADWELRPTKHHTLLQRIAKQTRGGITPGNLLSLGGLSLVLYGSWLLAHSNVDRGLVCLFVGRLCDLADGYVADWTKTKSRIGEAVDTTCDKISVLAIIVAGYATSLLPLPLLAVLTIHHAYIAVVGVWWGRKYRLHTQKIGKQAMFASWVAILLSLLYQLHNGWIVLGTLIAIIIGYGVLAVCALYSYTKEARRAVIASKHSSTWQHTVTHIVHIYNRRSSNYARAQFWIKGIAAIIGKEPHSIDIQDMDTELPHVCKSLGAKDNMLVTIAGGDGTVHAVVNLLETLTPPTSAILYILPLWGGNANDFSCMLNGQNTRTAPDRLIQQSYPAPVPLIQIILEHNTTKRVLYACCYASFGASAYAARQLDTHRISTRTIIRWLPPVLVARELYYVSRAMLEAPTHRARLEDTETNIYEHAIINGSRMAKTNYVPIELEKPLFFHATVSKKSPSLVLTILRILLRKPDPTYTTRSHLTFTLKNNIHAQVDGEVIDVPSSTRVTAISHKTRLLFISTRLRTPD